MQFHQNGFQVGDPELAGPSTDWHPEQAGGNALPAKTDVLIVGSGSAGLTLAAQLAAFPDIATCVVERRDGPLELGQADGITCRTMEMFNAFGFAEQVLREAYWVNETTFWRPDEDAGHGIVRGGWTPDTEAGLSEFPHVILNQARVHGFYLECMAKSAHRSAPCYGWRLADLTVDPDANTSHPVTAVFERGSAASGVESAVVQARYAVGCDGARSAVRRALGLALEGDSANQAWGVMDVLPVTDFPDVRKKVLIRSPGGGSVLIIPREGGYLTRFYVELDKLDADERVGERNLTLEQLIAAVTKVLRPYAFEVRDVTWWSVYEIGQRLCPRFDDVAVEKGEERLPRVFIAGDACHTHSPKAGQGMNVSMQDAFNLGWKLAAVLQGTSPPALLKTYSAERQAVAQDLINFDRSWSAMLSAPLKAAEDAGVEGVTPDEIQAYFIKQGRYTAGTATRYAPSACTGDGRHQALGTGFPVGMRFHSAPVVRLADARPMHLGHTIEADGRWRVFAFGDRSDPTSHGSALWRLCDFFVDDASSPLRRHTPSGADIDSLIDLRAVFQQRHHDLAIETAHPLLLPHKGRFAVRDYEKMFCADVDGVDIFDLRGIDRNRGCMVIVRPDQYVADILPLDDVATLANVFASVLLDSNTTPPDCEATLRSSPDVANPRVEHPRAQPAIGAG